MIRLNPLVEYPGKYATRGPKRRNRGVNRKGPSIGSSPRKISLLISLPVICRRFVGRREQLDILKTRWRACREGRGSTVLVGGDAGLGKSRLVSEFCGSTVGDRSAVATGDCLEYALGPFAPFVDILRSLMRDRPDALRDALAVRRILSPLFPEFASGSASPPATNTRQQYDAYVEAMRRLLGTGRTAVVIEDIHWADEGTLGLLQHLIHAAPSLPMLLVVTYRSDELGRNHRLVPVLSKITRKSDVFQTSLERLDKEEMDDWLGAVAKDHPALSRDSLQNTRRLAEGNPLFAEELITHAMNGGTDLPLTLREAVLERLKPFPPGERLVLVVAAVAGDRFDPEIVAEASGRPVADVLEAFRRARDIGLVLEDARGEGFSFRHALMREILYRELLAPEARTLHARIAAALERRSEGVASPVQLAHHFWEARDLKGAARYSEAAADAAELAGAHEDASQYYERTLEVAQATSLDSARLFRKLALALGNAGLSERSARACIQAIEHLEVVGDAERLAEMYSDLGVEQAYLGDVEASLASSVKGLNLIRSATDSQTRFKVLLGLASVELHHNNFKAALAYTDEALASSEIIDLGRRAGLLTTRAAALASTGDYTAALQAAAEALVTARNSGNDKAIVGALNHFGIVHAESGDEIAAIEQFERSAAHAADSFLTLDEAIALINRAIRLFVIGDIMTGLQAAAKARAACRRIEVPLLRLSIDYLNLLTALRVDDPPLCDVLGDEKPVESALRFGQPYSLVIGTAYAEGLGRVGRLAEAQAMFARALDTLRDATVELQAFVHAAQFAAESDLQRLRVILEPWAAAQPTNRGCAHLAYLDACIAQCNGDRDTAVRCAGDAARMYCEIGHPLPQALALEFAGETREALEIYRRIGSSRDAHRLDALLTPKGRRDRSTLELSDRERDVARLVAAGKSNKAIAESLSISARTVENHVASAIKKFGASSRTDLAAKLARDEV
jgi:predicted ATPase/DNA-binding CsgD family transcriptional regulator